MRIIPVKEEPEDDDEPTVLALNGVEFANPAEAKGVWDDLVENRAMESKFYQWAAEEGLLAVGPENDDIVTASLNTEIDD